MSPPNGPIPVPPVPPISLDPAAAEAAARALDELAGALRAVGRADGDQVAAATADWDGFTRWWFDHRHAEAVGFLQQAARQADDAAVAVRRAAVAAIGAHDQAVRQAERTARLNADRQALLAQRDLDPIHAGAGAGRRTP